MRRVDHGGRDATCSKEKVEAGYAYGPGADLDDAARIGPEVHATATPRIDDGGREAILSGRQGEAAHAGEVREVDLHDDAGGRDGPEERVARSRGGGGDLTGSGREAEAANEGGDGDFHDDAGGGEGAEPGEATRRVDDGGREVILSGRQGEAAHAGEDLRGVPFKVDAIRELDLDDAARVGPDVGGVERVVRDDGGGRGGVLCGRVGEDGRGVRV